jgi:hypothetical protein
MRKICQRFLVLLIIVLMPGCVSTRSIRYETIVRQLKPSNYTIEILDPANINHPYKVIGIVQANAGKLQSAENTIEHLKAEAKKDG